MKHLKLFEEFLSEGARYMDGKVVISRFSHEDDILINASKSKVKGVKNYLDTKGTDSKEISKGRVPIRVYWGLASIEGKKDLDSKTMAGDHGITLKEFMDKIKKNDFEMDKADDKKEDIVDFIKYSTINDKTGYSDLENIKYIVYAESSNANKGGSRLLPNIAEALQMKFRDAKVLELEKGIYTKYNILKDEYQIQDYDASDESIKSQLTEVLKKVDPDFSETGEKPMSTQNQLLHLFKVLDKMNAEDREFKITSDYNKIRKFIQTKYNYSEEIEKAIESCLYTPGRKMVILDDNVQGGNDFREIANVCNRIIERNQGKLVKMQKGLIANIFGFAPYKIYV